MSYLNYLTHVCILICPWIAVVFYISHRPLLYVDCIPVNVMLICLCRTIRWLDRCIKAHKRPEEQNLFPIVQGGLDAELRIKCAKGAWCMLCILVWCFYWNYTILCYIYRLPGVKSIDKSLFYIGIRVYDQVQNLLQVVTRSASWCYLLFLIVWLCALVCYLK